MTDRNLRPACPITGEPAARLIQMVGSKLLQGLWRSSFSVDTARQLGVVRRFGLWESPCGLAFFDPMIEGDATFYNDLYVGRGWHKILASPRTRRPEFTRTAEFVQSGARLLDVGCGEGGFARFVPQACYVGLEPSAYSTDGAVDIRHETIVQHAVANPAAYDVACAFQVIEHVANPFNFAAGMAACLKPGGRLILGVPCWPSALTDIPDFAFNAPPHHLSWWTEGALRALAGRLGLVVETVEKLPIGSYESRVYWMGRCSPKLTGRQYFRAARLWYLSLVWSWLAGSVANALFAPPANPRSMTLLLIARRPG